MGLKSLFFLLLVLGLSANELITPLPLHPTYNKPKALLGKALFSDVRLSKDRKTSCSSCHILEEGGTDHKPSQKIQKETTLLLNVPTVFNAVYNFKNFWDGRANNLTEQVRDSLLNPLFVGNDKKTLIQNVKHSYQNSFQNLYDDGVTFETIVDALVEFQKALTTPNAPFDKYLRGDKNALTYEEIRGYEVFKSSGCIACHNGINLGGNSYSKIEVLAGEKIPYLGRYNVTKNPKDSYFIKVPTLRNILLTSPYFHDGNIATIDEAIAGVSRHALQRKLTSSEIESLIHFLNTLTGELPAILKEDSIR